MAANVETMAYHGETPWHGMGEVMTDAQARNSEDVITLSGLDWTVSVEPIQTVSGLPIYGRGCRAIVRDDVRRVLGVVGRQYKVVQNREAFNFMDTAAAGGSIFYHTAGALGGGEKVWILAKIGGDPIRVMKTDDVIEKFALFANFHDGSGSLICMNTTVRVVCQNTFNLAMAQDGKDAIRIRHSGNIAEKIAQAQELLGITHRAFDDFGAAINRAAGVKMSSKMLKSYFESIYPDTSDGNRNRATATRERLVELFEDGPGAKMKGIKGTAWSAFNAVTDLEDHERGTKLVLREDGTKADPREKKLEAAWFGDAAKVKRTAWNAMMTLVDSVN